MFAMSYFSFMLLIILIGVLPAIFLIVYMYKQDKIEPEPPSLLIKLFIFGGLTTFVASILEELGMWIETSIMGDTNSIWFYVIEYFIVVGLTEEGVKYFALRKTTWYDPNFNYVFDACIYATTVSLGFAAFENVLYIFNYGLGVAPIRAVTAIPMHCIAGIFMGHYYGQAKFAEYQHDWSRMHLYNVLSVLIPMILHGFYDFCASSQDTTLSIIFYVYVIILDIFAFLSVKRYSKQDRGFNMGSTYNGTYSDMF